MSVSAASLVQKMQITCQIMYTGQILGSMPVSGFIPENSNFECKCQCQCQVKLWTPRILIWQRVSVSVRFGPPGIWSDRFAPSMVVETKLLRKPLKNVSGVSTRQSVSTILDGGFCEQGKREMDLLYTPEIITNYYFPKQFPIAPRKFSAVKQRGRERKGPPKIIQKCRRRNWLISSADFLWLLWKGQTPFWPLFRRRILGQYPAAPCSPGPFVLLLKFIPKHAVSASVIRTETKNKIICEGL